MSEDAPNMYNASQLSILQHPKLSDHSNFESKDKVISSMASYSRVIN